MNSTEINSIIDNLCDKLGTTANKLIPEMAGYQIAKDSIWLVISLIFIGVCIGLTIKLQRMRKANLEMLAIYPVWVKKLDDSLKSSGIINELPQWSLREWENTLDRARQAVTTVNYDESTWCVMVMSAVWSGLIGVVIFGVALMKIIGWSLSPHAMAFMWIINQLGGGQ